MKRGARRASCRELMSRPHRIGLLASIARANCDGFSSRASFPTRGKSRLLLKAAWRFRWRAS